MRIFAKKNTMKIKNYILPILLFLLINVIGVTTVTSFSTITAFPGNSVVITGVDFNNTAANNIVYFGETKAIATAVSSACLTVIVPLGATMANYKVINTSTLAFANSRLKFIPKYTNNITGSITTDYFKSKVDISYTATDFCTHTAMSGLKEMENQHWYLA
jgi:hypothetical protein